MWRVQDHLQNHYQRLRQNAKFAGQVTAQKPIMPSHLSSPGDCIVSMAVFFLLITQVAALPQVATLNQSGVVLDMAYSPDGHLLATASMDASVVLWDGSMGRRLNVLGHDGPVYALAFSPDGQRLATAGEDSTLRLWDPYMGRILWSANHQDAILTLAFSSDGHLLASGGFDNTICIWETATGRELARLEIGSPAGKVTFSPDGKHIAVAGSVGKVTIWNLTSLPGQNLTPGGIAPKISIAKTGDIDKASNTSLSGWENGSDTNSSTFQEAPVQDPLKGIPFPYYMRLKPADANSVVEIIRYADSIRNYAFDMNINSRAAFYEWFFQNHGFNVSFAYSSNFAGRGKPHLWLLVKTKKEVVELDPSFKEMGASCMEPLEQEYTSYEMEFHDIFQLASYFKGAEAFDWWSGHRGSEILLESVKIAQEEHLKGIFWAYLPGPQIKTING